MRILLLGTQAKRLETSLGCDYELLDTDGFLGSWSSDIPELVISFGYSKRLSRAQLESVGFQAINLHISMLPLNRGADPNFWSWLENTPKGVTLHWMNESLDGGDVIAQKPVEFEGHETLEDSYEELIRVGLELIGSALPSLVRGESLGYPQKLEGTFHNVRDRRRFRDALPDGWKTTGEHVRNYGREQGLWRFDESGMPILSTAALGAADLLSEQRGSIE